MRLEKTSLDMQNQQVKQASLKMKVQGKIANKMPEKKIVKKGPVNKLPVNISLA